MKMLVEMERRREESEKAAIRERGARDAEREQKYMAQETTRDARLGKMEKTLEEFGHILRKHYV